MRKPVQILERICNCRLEPCKTIGSQRRLKTTVEDQAVHGTSLTKGID